MQWDTTQHDLLKFYHLMSEKQIPKRRYWEKRGENAISETQKNIVATVVEESSRLALT